MTALLSAFDAFYKVLLEVKIICIQSCFSVFQYKSLLLVTHSWNQSLDAI